MASQQLRHSDNVAGDFFVDTTCIDCDQCRRIAPRTFAAAGEQSVVHAQPADPGELQAALEALVTCPVGSIGTSARHDVRPALVAFPQRVESNVYFCGFAAESSFGASSWLVVRPEGNVLVDSPRFSSVLAKQIAALGGVRTLFLTHRDDVADHARWAERFGAERVLHRGDLHRGLGVIERVLDGDVPVPLAPDLVAIPTPGHTRGHCALLHADRFLFTGDHLWWSEGRQRLVASRSVCWWSWPEQIRSLERLLAHEFEWILPGHGWRLHAPRARMRALLEDCIARARAA